jgi:hypothetical protein
MTRCQPTGFSVPDAAIVTIFNTLSLLISERGYSLGYTASVRPNAYDKDLLGSAAQHSSRSQFQLRAVVL